MPHNYYALLPSSISPSDYLAHSTYVRALAVSYVYYVSSLQIGGGSVCKIPEAMFRLSGEV